MKITGSFWNWGEPIDLKKSIDEDIFGAFHTEIPLESGRRYEFKFVVDGVWMCSEDFPKCTTALGENNYLEL